MERRKSLMPPSREPVKRVREKRVSRLLDGAPILAVLRFQIAAFD
jgi:hypothetical protein